MKSRKFPSLHEAIAYLESRGTLVYFGRNGTRAEINIYTLTVPSGKVYHLSVDEDGLVRVMD